MRKIKRIYYAVLLLTAILLITVSNQIGAINISLKDFGNAISNTLFIRDTAPSPAQKILKDTIPPLLKDTTPTSREIDSTKIDTTKKLNVDSFSLKLSKDSFSAPITYHANDSAVGLVQNKTIQLFGNAKTEYQSSTLQAPYMMLNQQTGLVYAKGKHDSTGAIETYVEMNDGQSPYKSDSLVYNIKNQKGFIRGTITQQGEMFLHSEIAKKVDSNTVYAMGNFFTTCNLDVPHFGFRARRAKIINKKLAVTGAVHPEFDSVPVPIYLPFGFYPLYQGRHSGVIAPSFQTNDQEGLGLAGMGYYIGLSDYWDAKIYGDIYSYGTWNLNINPTYRKIYRYQGNINVGIQSTRRNNKSDPDFYKSNTYSLSVSHSTDSRARPGVSFSANVNMSSTNYNRNIPDQPQLNYQNVLSSSVTYSKQWQDKPFNLSLSFNHSQNNQSRLMTINFPTANFTVNTIYPFQKKDAVGSKKWYEQLGIGYTGSFRNDFNFYDSLSYSKSNPLVGNRRFFKYLWDTARYSANHSIPISLSLPPVLNGALVIAPSVSYSQEWVDKVSTFSWGPRTFYTRKLDNSGDSTYIKDTINAAYSPRGIYIKQQTSFGISFNTTVYGQYKFTGKKIDAIRHVMRPTFSLNYTPDLIGRTFYQTVQIDSAGTTALFSKLDGLYSRPTNQFTSRRSGGISFGIDNSLEMKVHAKQKKKKGSDMPAGDSTRIGSDSTNLVAAMTDGAKLNDSTNTVATGANPAEGGDNDAENGLKKIKLIDGFGFNGSYNFLADSLKLSPISLYLRTNLFSEGDLGNVKTDGLNFNASATLIPYKLSEYGYATKEYAWQGGGGFKVGTITNATISLSTGFSSKPKDPEKDKARKEAVNKALNDPMMQADQQRLLDYMQQNPAEFVDFNTDWQTSLSFSLNYTRLGRNVLTLQNATSPVTASANFTGGFNLTPKWNFSVNGFYDFTTSKIQSFSMNISRDMHCWQMSISVTPIGLYSRFFSFTISPKAGILQDLKINRTRSFYTTQ